MNQNSKYENKKKEGKHKFHQECLTKCIKWKLNVTLSHNKNSSGLVINKEKYKSITSPLFFF